MLTDNGHQIVSLLKNKHARFDRAGFDGKIHYIALNRAARRFIRSKEVQNIAKQLGLVIDLELNTIS